MTKVPTNSIKTCEKCSENVKLYIVCFKCDLIYHPNCWRKLPGAYLNEKGHAFCCWNITIKEDVFNTDLQTQERAERSIKGEYELEHVNVSGNCHLKDDLQKEQKLSQQCLDLNRNKLKQINTSKCCTTVKQGAESKKYKCNDCKYATNRKGALGTHVRIHSGYRSFKCTYTDCKCTPEQKQTCKCNTCGYAAVEKHRLKQHILMKHSEEPKKYKCIHCQYAAHKKQHLDRHMRTHTNDRPFKCTYKNCECTAGQEKSCNCDMCGYAAKLECRLKMHILYKHSGEPKKYKCTNCNYAAHGKRNLERHVRTHTTDRPFKCTYRNCKCAAGQKESCKCDMCDYAAIGEHSLKMHILVKHSGESKKYNCANCKYATHSKTNIEHHVHTHTNDRPFKCTYKDCNCSPEQKESCKCNPCRYSAVYRQRLNMHILNKHSS